MRSFVFFSHTGCLLPLIIIFDLMFGWMFLRPLLWLEVTLILILLFILNSFFMAKKIMSAARRHDNVIDVKGEVMEEERKKIG